MNRIFNDIQKEWLLDKKNYLDKNISQILGDFNREFQVSYSHNQIQNFYSNRRISINSIIYTKEKLEWLSKNIYYYNYENLTKEFNKKFGLNVTRKAIETKCVRNGFKRENSPHQKQVYKKKIYSKEIVDFLNKNYNKLSKTELLINLNKTCNVSYKMGGLIKILKNLDLYDKNHIISLKRKGVQPIGYICKFKDKTNNKERYMVKTSILKVNGKNKTNYEEIPKEIYLNSLIMPKLALAYGINKEVGKKLKRLEVIYEEGKKE